MVPNPGTMAQRAFNDCVNDAEHNFGRHPEDYTLFKIGEFDDQTAEINWETPQSLGNGIEYVLTPVAQKDLFNENPIGEYRPATNAQDIEILKQETDNLGETK